MPYHDLQLILDDLSNSWIPDIIGCVGTLIILVAYLLLQTGKLRPVSLPYSFLNFMGALMILVSLFFAWNLAAVIMEATWVCISVFGLIRSFTLVNIQTHKK